MPYQKIIRENKMVQKGNIDTYKKFDQLFAGVSIKGKRIADVGCNTGEMGHIAKKKGASYYLGVDARSDFIQAGQKINPDLSFRIGRAEELAGRYDIIIASAMFHYITDHHKFFNQLARCSKMVVMDVWLHDSIHCGFFKTHRNLFIPSELAFLFIAGKYFKKIEKKGASLSPDASTRFIFHLSAPKPIKAKAILIYGKSRSGKTTTAKAMHGFQHLQLDQIFVDGLIDSFRSRNGSITSVSELVEGLDTYKTRYLKRHSDHLTKWLSSRINRDVVIEGYDMIKDDYRGMVVDILKRLGWTDIEEKHFDKTY